MRTSATGNSAPARANGYTLLELLVVMLMIGLVASLATSLMPSQNSQWRLATDARKVAGLIAEARDQARLTGRLVRLEAAADGETLTREGAKQALRLASGTTAKVLPLVRQDPAQQALLFFPDGSNSGGTVELRSGTASLRISVDWLTGRPHVR